MRAGTSVQALRLCYISNERHGLFESLPPWALAFDEYTGHDHEKQPLSFAHMRRAC